MQCQRCRGYLINDHFIDILNVSGEMNFTGWRCLNCGDINRPSHCTPSPDSTERSCEIEAALVGGHPHAVRLVNKQKDGGDDLSDDSVPSPVKRSHVQVPRCGTGYCSRNIFKNLCDGSLIYSKEFGLAKRA